MAWNFTEVQSTSQFLLVDDKPNSAFAAGLDQVLEHVPDRAARARRSRKASFFSYPAPIWLPKTHVRARRPFLVWGMRRNAADGVPQQATVQYATEKGRAQGPQDGHHHRPRGYMQAKVAYCTVACWGTPSAALRRMPQTRNERRALTCVFGSQIGTG